jgi:hypothetical protein
MVEDSGGHDLRHAIQNVETWIEMLNEAGHAHDRLAPVVVAHIEGTATADEILRFVPFMASLSSQTRVDIETTLHTILTALRSLTQASRGAPPGASPGGLHSVP